MSLMMMMMMMIGSCFKSLGLYNERISTPAGRTFKIVLSVRCDGSHIDDW